MLADVFAKAKRESRAALIVYLVAGDPDLETTERVIDAVTEAGADVIELGIPYGDPLADGPTIAAAAHRALLGGTTIRDTFDLVAKSRARGTAPILYFTYANPVDRYGEAKFAKSAAKSGAIGAIVPDIALEESRSIREELKSNGLVMPLLVAPTTPLARAKLITGVSEGFTYVVSRLGVTGAGRTPDLVATRARVADLREFAAGPLAVGFGISRAEDVHEVASFADGVIVGSALIDAYAGSSGAAAAARAGTYIRELAGAAEQ